MNVMVDRLIGWPFGWFSAIDAFRIFLARKLNVALQDDELSLAKLLQWCAISHRPRRGSYRVSINITERDVLVLSCLLEVSQLSNCHCLGIGVRGTEIVLSVVLCFLIPAVAVVSALRIDGSCGRTRKPRRRTSCCELGGAGVRASGMSGGSVTPRRAVCLGAKGPRQHE